MSDHKFSIAFLIKRPGTGGVETLAIRKVNYLKQSGHLPVLIMLFPWKDSGFYAALSKDVPVFYLCNPFHWRKLIDVKFEALYTFEIIGSLIGNIFSFFKIINRKKHCIGVYHPLEYCWSAQPHTKAESVTKEFFLSLASKNICFMNESNKQRHEHRLEKLYSNSPVIPLGINLDRWAKVMRTPIKFKILSVGRLETFKTYNTYAIEAVDQLIKDGFDVHYEIYGDGVLKDAIIDKANSYNLSDKISLKGPIPYSLLNTVFCDAYVFIGCGTALVEAAAAGIPSLIGIESYPDSITYGLFSESQGANVGEIVNGHPKFTFYSQLRKIFEMTQQEYQTESDKERARSQEFSQEKTMALFLNYLKNASTNSTFSVYKSVQFLTSYFFWKACALLKMCSPLHDRYVDSNIKS